VPASWLGRTHGLISIGAFATGPVGIGEVEAACQGVTGMGVESTGRSANTPRRLGVGQQGVPFEPFGTRSAVEGSFEIDAVGSRVTDCKVAGDALVDVDAAIVVRRRVGVFAIARRTRPIAHIVSGSVPTGEPPCVAGSVIGGTFVDVCARGLVPDIAFGAGSTFKAPVEVGAGLERIT
jgi:hypothetical protein